MEQEQYSSQNADMIIKNAKEIAKEIIMNAEKTAKKIVSESELLKIIKQESEKIKKQALEYIDTKKIQAMTGLDEKDVKLYKDLSDKPYLNDEEFDIYKTILKKLTNPYDKDNRERMYQPFLKTGKYWENPIEKIVNLTRSAELKDEEWEPELSDETTFQVSNYGRVRKIWKENGKYRGEILFQYEKCAKSDTTQISEVIMDDYYDGYLWVDLPKEVNTKEKPTKVESIEVYKLVAKYWLDEKGCDKKCSYDIHHINNNGYENTPANLIRLKKCQHKQLHSFMCLDKFPESCKKCDEFKKLLEKDNKDK